MNFKETPFPTKAKNLVWKADLLPTTFSKRIAVFASYSANGKIADYVTYYLKGLKKVCDTIIFIADNPLLPKELEKIKKLVVYAKAKRHYEYDFGSYKRGYLYACDNHLLDNAEELIFCNDSCYGPIFPFKKMFDTMSKKKTDFWGVCANDEYQYHLQSYFLAFHRNVFCSTAFRKFVKSIKKEANVSDVILKYETKFTNILQNAGFKCESYIPFAPDDKTYPYKHAHNLTFFPVYLMEQKCPLLKLKAVTIKKHNHDGIENTLDFLKKANPTIFKFLSIFLTPKS